MMHQNKAIRSVNSPYRCSIPQDVIDMQILHRLPIRCLFRLKSVSRHWNSFISSYAFVKYHLRYQQNYSFPNLFFQVKQDYPRVRKCIFRHGRYSIREPSKLFTFKVLKVELNEELSLKDRYCNPNYTLLRSMHDYEPPNIGIQMKEELIGSCNGLICMQFTKDNNDARRGRPGRIICFLMWNPLVGLIHQRRAIKGPFIPFQSKVIASGLGYGSSTDDYKIMVLVKELNKASIIANIYSLRKRKWTKCCSEDCLLTDYKCNRNKRAQPVVLANETLYWLLEDESYGPKLVALELNNDSFSFVPLPSSIPKVLPSNDSLVLCETRQRLCVYWKKTDGRDFINNSVGIEVWVLQESWTQLFQFTRFDLRVREATNYFESQALHLDQEDKALYLGMGNSNLESIKTRGQEYGGCIDLSTHIPTDDRYRLSCGFSYVESLVSPFFHVG